MKELKLFLIPILSSVVVFFMVSKSYEFYEDTAKYNSISYFERLAQQRFKSAGVDANTIRTITNLVEGLMLRHKLPLTVSASTEKKSITIVNSDKSPQGVARLLGSDANYAGIMSLFSDFPELPYSMSFKSACLGMDCSGGLEMEISIK